MLEVHIKVAKVSNNEVNVCRSYNCEQTHWLQTALNTQIQLFYFQPELMSSCDRFLYMFTCSTRS